MRAAQKQLTPSTVARKLAAVQSFLRFCRLTGLTRVTSEIIALALKSPTATVNKPYEVLAQTEQAHVLKMLHDRRRGRTLVALALGLSSAACAQRSRDASRIHYGAQVATRRPHDRFAARRNGPHDTGASVADHNERGQGSRDQQAAQPTQF
jgi:hypothetical protein